MINLLFIVGGLIALYAGGELLVRAAVTLGQWMKLSSLVIGLTIVALGTSAPEFAVSLDAALVGSSEIAIANVVGSNFANIALVLAISALFCPIAIDPTALKRDIPIMLLSFIAMGFMLYDGEISLLDGALLISSLATYLIYVIWQSRRQQIKIEYASETKSSILATILMLVGGILLLAIGGHWLVEGAIIIARQFNVSEAIIGMTVVAIGTSLPEITASIISIIRGESSMAVGNVVGSNIWNTLGVLGATSAIMPLEQGGVSINMYTAMVGAGIVLWLFCRTKFHLSRFEGIMLFVGYITCQAWIVL